MKVTTDSSVAGLPVSIPFERGSPKIAVIFPVFWFGCRAVFSPRPEFLTGDACDRGQGWPKATALA
jgi:hypothetical protein